MPPYRIWLGQVARPGFPRYADPHRPQLLLGTTSDDPVRWMKKLTDGSLDHSKFAQTYGIEPRMDLLETHLDQLPGVYDPDLFETKCGLVYEYIFSRGELVR